jgi:hypothetical protein
VAFVSTKILLLSWHRAIAEAAGAASEGNVGRSARGPLRIHPALVVALLPINGPGRWRLDALFGKRERIKLRV